MCGLQPAHILVPIRAIAVPPSIDGNDGIAITGREEAYATALWMENPTAFWLHPEGPLSDKTPDEWRAERSGKALRRIGTYASTAGAITWTAGTPTSF